MMDVIPTQASHSLEYHITPEVGLMNDPNGLVYFHGEYHVFFQWNPTGLTHTNKHWGHVVSQDMLHWQRLPAALSPSKPYDKDGIYSGSAVVHDDILYLFYTGNVVKEDGCKESYQCLATSTDGRTFIKHGCLFPHPEGYTRHVRDPKVWQADDFFWMLVGAQTVSEIGTVLLYRSKNLFNWEFMGPFGENLPVTLGYMWECPDYLYFEETDVLLFCPQGLMQESHHFANIHQSGYFTGRLTTTGHFKKSAEAFQELDAGFEFYAPQTFQHQGRTIMYGWMGFMSPEQESALPTVYDNWVHTLTIPRVLKIENQQVIQQPVPEMMQLRSAYGSVDERLTEDKEFHFDQSAFELDLFFEKTPTEFCLALVSGFVLRYDAQNYHLILERKNWLNQQIELRVGELNEGLTHLQLFVDGSSVEIFANHGHLVFSARYFMKDGQSKQRTVRIEGERLAIHWHSYLLDTEAFMM